MSRNKPSKNQYSQGLTYVSATPSFLKHFGQPKPPSPRPNSHSTSQARDGREPLPERPRSGEWASGSDDEKAEREEEEEEEEGEDEWGEMYGGGEEGPQVVVLKEGRHLTGEEVKRERRRAAGRASQLPPPSASGKPPPSASGKPPPSTTTDSAKIKPNIQLPKPAASSAKRKLVGSASLEVGDGDGKIDSGKAGKKKKKGKGMLSFDDAEEGG